MMESIGRFAPTPSGRMHLGNVMCAFLAYLSCKKQNGRFVLRIEDLDEARCHFGDNSIVLMDDLHWLGIFPDQGEDRESFQSNRFDVYEKYFQVLKEKGLVYPCYCSRADLHAASAPHLSDGLFVYSGKCRQFLTNPTFDHPNKNPSFRVKVEDEIISFNDGLQGDYASYMPRDAGDFVVKRADGVFAYQLACTVDDGLSNVGEIVRGKDLISSTPIQMYLQKNFGFQTPQYYHIPLLVSETGERLSKRDHSLDMGFFKNNSKGPESVIGYLSFVSGITDILEPVSMKEAMAEFSWKKIKKDSFIMKQEEIQKIMK